MFQDLRQKVDTKCKQVDTREPSQKACFSVWDMVSTLNHLRSTIETSPRELIFQSGTDSQRQRAKETHKHSMAKKSFNESRKSTIQNTSALTAHSTRSEHSSSSSEHKSSNKSTRSAPKSSMAMRRAPSAPMGEEASYGGPKRARTSYGELLRLTDLPNHLSSNANVREDGRQEDSECMAALPQHAFDKALRHGYSGTPRSEYTASPWARTGPTACGEHGNGSLQSTQVLSSDREAKDNATLAITPASCEEKMLRRSRGRAGRVERISDMVRVCHSLPTTHGA
ncbi:hypothetical protein Taro_024206, partial [Colocasia esculenta]|nr:hypothetical protein [Colocasia esculenta]